MPLDRETNASIMVTIVARDQGDPPLNATTNVLVNVIDVNDNPPQFLNSLPSNFSIRENSTVGTFIGRLIAVDEDEPNTRNSRINYTIVDGSGTDVFNLNPTSGDLTIASELNFENTSQYSLEIAASDAGSPSMNTTRSFTIYVVDIDDNVPLFVQNTFQFEIVENNPRGAFIGRVIANDLDPHNRTIGYRFAAPSPLFAIDRDTGRITARVSLDREQVQPQYILEVQTFYQDDPANSIDVADVVVTVIDVNEVGVIIHSFDLGTVNENVAEGTMVGRINATDRDPSSNLTYFLSVTLDVLSVDESGVVFVSGLIDRESTILFPAGNSFCPANTPPDVRCLPAIVRVTDITTGDADEQSARLQVRDLDDEPPLFTRELYEISINESTRVGAELSSLNIRANDPDYDIIPEYSIPAGQNVVDFSILPFSGVITISQALDYEQTEFYNFTVVASDPSGNRGSATVEITILDVNDNAPQFLEPFYNTTISEDSDTGVVIAVVTARDIDSGTNSDIRYEITNGNIRVTFDIDPQNGDVTLIKSLNREVVSLFSLTIEAVDGGTPAQTSQVLLNVTIGDVNDHPPFFTQSVYSGNVRETATIGAPVLNATTGQPLFVEAIDLDIGAEVTILSFTNGVPFNVDSSTGAVTVSASLDFEQNPSFEFIVVARDELFLFSSPARVLIQVLGFNDHRPVFQRGRYDITIMENTGAGDVVLQVTAEDQDLRDSVRYRITSNFNASEIELPEPSSGMIMAGELVPEPVFPFIINDTTGAITLIESLDFEIVRQWNFTVVAEDSEGLNGTAAVTVRVGDQNDNPPRFTEHVYQILLPENTNLSTTVPVSTEVRATDSDLVSEDNLRYYITRGAQGTFEMDRFTGDLFLVAQLNLLQRVYNIEIVVSDGLNEDTARIDVIVVDINNNGPVFLQENYLATMLENVTTGTSVLQVQAIDSDLDIFGEVTYELVAGETELFYISSDTGEIFVNESGFDFDTPPRSYYLRVEAMDGADPPRKAFANVTIALADINDNSPEFVADPFVVSVPEASDIGMSVFQVMATDADSGTNEIISFDIITIGANFTIDRDTGVVRVASVLDFDDPLQPREMYLEIEATDGGQPSLSSNGTLIINITDSNDNAPYFANILSEVLIPENTTINGTAFIAEAFDNDSGVNAELSYEILSVHPPSCASRFRIVNSTGVVLLSETVDAEDRGEPCTIVVEATDNGTPRRSSQTTYVAIVTDINEDPPVFFLGSLVGSVPENSPNSTSVLTIRAFDNDLNRVFFEATGGDVAFFDVSRLGVVTVAEGVELDREVRERYTLTIMAEDDGIPQMFTTGTVTITLLDENDNPPVFLNESYFVSVRELHPLDTPVVMVRATDDDITPNNVIRYYIVSNSENETDYGKFEINSETGDMFIVSSLDYETERHFYHLQVEATDGLNNATVNVNIRLLESNDERPIFTNLPNTTNLREDAENDTLVFQANAVDTDLGVNGRIVYSLSETLGSERFRIDAETGDLFVRGDDQFDFESGIVEIQLVIVATDSAGAMFSGDNEAPRSSGFGLQPLVNPNDMRLSMSQTLLVNITDVNDERPQFSMPVYFTFTIEHEQLSLVVGTVFAFDNDEPSTPNSEVWYRIAGGDFGKFAINNVTGVITTVPPIDREDRASYAVEVEAFDLGVPSLNSTAIVNVTVINTDDERPLFPQTINTGVIDENSPEDTLVTVVTAIDPDSPDSPINYTLFDPSGHFKIDEATGMIYTSSSPIDREEIQNITLIVQAVDIRQFFTTADVFIVVNDVNDQAPIFEQESYFFNITENTPVNSRLTGIQATDIDLGSNAITRYRIEHMGRFGVDTLTGDVIITQPLCFNDSNTRTYTLRLTARDANIETLNSAATLTISVYKQNNYPPVFVQPSYVSRLDEQAPIGTVVVPSLRTIDEDICSGPPVFNIVSGDENNTFAINRNSGTVTLTRNLMVDDLSFTLTLTATDTGNFNLPNMTSDVTLIVLIGQLLPLSIAVTEGGLTVPTISRVSQEIYQQNIWLFNGGSLTDPPSVRFSIGSLVQETSVPVVPSPAQRVDAALASDVVYPGEPYVVVGLQAEGEGYEKTGVEATEVFVRVESDLLPGQNTTASCFTESPSATCVARTPIPMDWFLQTENSTVRVYYGLSQDSADTFLGEIRTVSPAPCPLLPGPQVRVELPSRVIYPGDYFNICVSMNAEYEIRSYLMVFSMAEGLEFVDILTSIPRYIIQTAVRGNSFSISALNNGMSPNMDPVDSFEELVIRVQLRPNAPIVAEEVITLNCTVEYIVNVLGQQVFTSEPAVHINFNERGSCNSTVGELLAAPSSIVRLFAYANHSGLLNSAYLNGNTVRSSISILSFLRPGRFNSSDTQVFCQSDNTVLKVASNCSHVFLTGNETTGADPVNVVLSSSYGSVSIPFRVWFPTGIAINPGVMELNPLSGVFRDGCNQEYESTRVDVEAVFQAGSDLRQTAIITPLVRDSIRSSQTSIMDLILEWDTVQAFGRSRGTATIEVDIRFGPTVSSQTITITNNFVTVEDISLTLHSGLSPLPIPTAPVGSSYLETSQVQLQSNFMYINMPVSVLTEAVLSDGRNFELSASNGLSLTSRDVEVLQVASSNEIILRGSGMGLLLEGVLGRADCPGSVQSNSEFLDIQIPPFRGLEVTLGATTLATPDHSLILGVPSETSVEVQLVHEDGTMITVTNDNRTTFNTTLAPFTIRNGTVLSGPSPGEATFMVTYFLRDRSIQQTEGPITILSIVDLQLSALPYPSFTGATTEDATVLNRFANTSIYQQAEVMLTAILSDNSTMDVTLNNATAFSISDPSVLSIEGRRITPVGPGNSTITAFLGGLNLSFEFTVLDDEEVSAVEITEFSIPLQNGTLFATQGTVIVPSLTLRFSDGTYYPNFISSSGSALPSLIEFSALVPSFADIDNVTGLVTVHANSFEQTSLTAAIPTVDSREIVFSVDLLPRLGEVDIEGLLQTELQAENSAEVRVFLNVEGVTLGAVEVSVEYDNTVLALATMVGSSELADVDRGADVRPGDLTAISFVDESPGRIRFGGISERGTVGTSRLHIATLRFNVLTSASFAFFTTSVVTLNEFSTVSSPIGDPTVRVSPPATIGPVNNSAVTNVTRCSNPPCSLEECLELTGTMRAGDANADCTFDLIDALFIQEYAPLLSLPSGSANLLPEQLEAMDADRNGRIELNDARALVEARFGLRPLIPNLTLRPIDAEFSDCRLTINVTIQTWDGTPPASSFAYFGLFHPSPDFQNQYDNTTFNIGTKNTDINFPMDTFGGWLDPEFFGGGVYGIETEPGIIAQRDIGFLLVVGVLDPVTQVPTRLRTVIFTGHPTSSLAYTSLNATFTPVMDAPGVSIILPTFNPQQFFNNSFPADLCYNNHPPVIRPSLRPGVIVTISEATEINTPLRTITASDADFPLPAGMLLYSLVNVTEPGTLGVNPETGEVFVAGVLDRESYLRVTATFVATDQGPHIFTRRRDTIPFVLILEDANDNPPLAEQPLYSVNISEGVVVPEGGQSESVFTFTGRDADVDADNRGFSLVSITDGDDPISPFFSVRVFPNDVNSFTGILTLVRSLDRETQDSYNLTITLVDGGTPPQSSEVLVQVMVTDINDQRPVFTTSDEVGIRENNSPPSFVTRVNATDADIGPNAQFTYQITSVEFADDEGVVAPDAEPVRGFFSLDPQTGVLTVLRRLDREGNHSFRVHITTAEVGINIIESSILPLWVMVCEENDNRPFFPDELVASVPENSNRGRIVTQVVGRDLDGGAFCSSDTDNALDNILRYSLLTADIPFVMDEVSGNVSVNGSLDFEAIKNYSVVVEVRDLGRPPLSSTALLTIFVTDENDHPPVLSNTTYFNLAVENSTVGSVVIDFISATDDDSGQNAEIRFNLTGEGSQNFMINPVTGVISIAQSLDREQQPVYRLTVIAYDLGIPTLTDTAVVTIEVIDINDNPPVFNQSEYSVVVTENVPLGDVVLTVTAVDADLEQFRDITYEIEDDSSQLFRINPLSGEITTTDLLCTLENVTYSFVVVAEDHPGGELRLRSSVNVTILVYDDNSFDPLFTRSEYAAIVADGTTVGGDIIAVVATDQDICSPPFSYLLLSSPDAPLFTLNSTSGLLTVNTTLDQTERDLYTLTVSATDSSTPNPRTGTATVYVIVGETVPVDFSSTVGFPVESSRAAAASDTFEQTFDYLYNTNPFQTSQFSATFGILTSQAPFLVTPLPATQLDALLLTPTVYFDNPVVSVALVAHDEFGSNTVSDVAVIVSATSPLGFVNISRFTDTPTVMVGLELPAEWFMFSEEEERNVTVSYRIFGQSPATFEQVVSLVPRPQYEVVCDTVKTGSGLSTPDESLMIVQIPSYTLYNGQTASIPVLVRQNENISLSAFSLRCDLDAGLQFSPTPVSTAEGWEARYEEDSTRRSLSVAATKVTSGAPQVGFQEIVTLQISVTSDTSEIVGVSCFRLDAVDTDGNSDSYSEALVADRNGCRAEAGSVFVSEDVLVGVFAVSDQTVIFNDAVLSGTQRNIYPSIAGVVLASTHRFDNILVLGNPLAVDDLTCSTEDEDVLKVDSRCRQVYMDGSETSGAESVRITFNATSLRGNFRPEPNLFPVTLDFQVWFPDLPISITPTDAVLSPVEGWTVSDGPTCTQAYQKSSIEATAVFRPGFNSSFAASAEVRVENLLSMNFQSENTTIATVSGTEITGVRPGTAVINAVHPLVRDVPLGSTVVTVDSISVRAIDFDVSYSTDLTTSELRSVPYVGSDPFQAILNPDLQYETQMAHLVTTAVFSDGTRYRLSPDLGLNYSSTDSSIVSVTAGSTQFTALDSGSGSILRVNWAGCGNRNVLSLDTPLDINLRDPEIRVAIVDPILVHPNDPAAGYSGIATSSRISVSLVYELESETISFDITNSASTNYTLSPPGLLTMRVEGSDRFIDPAVPNTPAAINVLVSYKSYPPVTADITLTYSQTFNTTASPYPEYNGSINRTITELSIIGSTRVFQQARLRSWVELPISGGSPLIIDVSSSPFIQYTSVPINVATISPSGVVTPQVTGAVDITVQFSGMTSDLSVQVLTRPLTVSSIDRLGLMLGDTLSGLPGETAARLSAAVTFRDGTRLEEVYTPRGQAISGLLTAVSNNLDIFTIDSDSGNITILSNSLTAVSLTVIVNDANRNQTTANIFANLQPAIGEMDLGGTAGPPVPPVSPGESFEVPVRINIGSQSVGALEIDVAYDDSLLELVSTSNLTNLFASSGRLFPGYVRLGGAFVDAPPGSILHVGTLVFRARVTVGGIAAIRGGIASLFDRSNPPRSLSFTSSPAANIGVAIGNITGLPPPSELNIPSSYFNPSVPTCTDPPPCMCSDGKEVGDVDGNCIFNVADVFYLEQAGTLNCPDNDFNLDGVCNDRDITFLLRANFRLVHFVRNLQISPVNDTDCFLTIEAELIGRGDEIADPSTTSLLFGLFNREPDFQQEVDSTTVFTNVGQRVRFTGELPASTNGGFFETTSINETFRAILNTQISKPSVGLVLVQTQMDSYSQLSEDLVEIMVGREAIPVQFPETLDASVEHPTGFPIPFSFRLGFNSLVTFDQTFSSPDCINFNQPQFFPNTTRVSLYENLEIGSTVATVFANDSDAGANADVVYSLYQPTDDISNTFAINRTTGEVTLIASLDRESRDIYYIGIRAIDQGTLSSLGGFGELVVMVLDVNDNNPRFDEEVYTPPSIPEDTPVGYVVETVRATDQDLGENRTISYTLTEPKFEFEINDTTGEIYVATMVDFEVRMQYNLTVIASDDGSPPREGSASVIVVIEPINDNTPRCHPIERLALVAEDEFADTTILVVNASDADLGANHNQLTFSLSTNAEFGIRKTSETTAEIYTLVENFDRIMTPSYVITVNVSDIDGFNCSIDVLVVVAEPSQFDFEIENAGFLTGPVVHRRSRDGFDQQVTFFRDSFPNGTISGSLGERTDTEMFSRRRQPLSRLDGVLRQREVWFDNPSISAVAQVRDASLLTTVMETPLFLQITPTNSSLAPEISPACVAEVGTGLCNLVVTVPAAWFDPVSGYTEVSITLTGGTVTVDLGTVTINPIPSRQLTQDNLLVELPTYDLYTDNTFTVWVGAPSSLQVIAFQLNLRVPTPIMLGVLENNTQWACNRQEDMGLHTFVCLRTSSNVGPATSTGTERFFGIQGYVVDVTTQSMPEIEAEVLSLSSTYGSVISVPTRAIVFDRGGLSMSPGQLYLEPNAVVGILASADRPELINTAVLDNSDVPVSVKVYAVYNRPDPAYSILDSNLHCSSDSNIVISSSLCDAMTLATNYTGEVGETAVTITHTLSLSSFSLPLKIWQVSNMQIEIPDQELNRIFSSGCDGLMYQWTEVRVLATFRSGNDYSNDVDVTSVAAEQISSNDNTIAVVNGRTVIGISAGSAEISIGGFSTRVTVTEEEVMPYSLNPTIFTSLDVSVDPPTYSPNSTLMVSSTIGQEFNDVGINGFAAGLVYFSDGARLDISNDDDFILTSDTPDVVQVSSNGTIVAIAPGRALIASSWTPPACPPILTAESSFTVTAPASTGLEVSATSLTLAGNTGGIAFDSLPSSSQITVLLLFVDGTRRDVTSEVTLSSSPSLTLSGNTVSATIMDPAPRSGELNVTYTTAGGQMYSETIQFTLVNVVRLNAQLDSYPNPTGTPGTDITLEQVGNTGYWQEAVLIVDAVLSDSSTQRVPGLAGFMSNIVPSGRITVSEEGVVTPVAGESGITTILLVAPDGTENRVTVDVSGSSVSVRSIDSLSLEETSPAVRRIIANVTLSDGTVLTDIFNLDSGDFSSFISFSLDPPSVAIVDSSAGTLTITESHYEAATLTATASGSSASVMFVANLQPVLGEIDLGQDSGVPQPPVTVGNEFTVRVRVNIGSSTLGALDVSLLYDPSVLEVTMVTPLLPGFSAVRTNSPPGEIQIVFAVSGMVPGPTPPIANVTLRANREGMTQVSSVLRVLADDTRNQTSLSGTETSRTGNLSVPVVSPRGRREARATGFLPRVTRQTMPASVLGDTNGDGQFDVRDAAYVAQYLVNNQVATAERMSILDPNKDGAITLADVVFLVRAAAGLVPFLDNYNIRPVSKETSCMLDLSARLVFPLGSHTNYTFVYFILSHPQASSLLSVTEASPGISGTVIGSNSSIFEAYPSSESGIYRVSLYTPINFQQENIGLSIAVFTTEQSYTTTLDRFVTFITTQHTTYVANGLLVPQIQGATLRSKRETAATLTDVTIGEPDGFSPLTNFTNRLRSDYCSFSGSVIPISVPENQTTRTTFRNISALNPGFPSSGEAYMIFNASATGVFSLNGSGELQLVVRLDYESITSYNLTINATVPGLNNYIIGTAMLVITVLDVNDNAPQFGEPAYSVEIPENVLVSELLVRVGASDADSGINNEIIFSLDPPNSQFSLNSTSGELTVAATLDRESIAGYNLTVLATDRGSPPLSSNVTVRVTVLDINDNAPRFDQSEYTIPIPEDFPVDNVVTMERVRVTDPDARENGTVDLTLVPQDDSAPFTIDDEGYLTVTATLDRETKSSYGFTVIARDRSVVSMSANASLTVIISDVNDNNPVFSPENDVMLLVEEDSLVDTVVTRMIATDQDEGSNSIITYTITESGIPFEIDGTSGEIRIVAPLNLELRQEYRLVIVARDNGAPVRNATWNLTIDVVERQVVSFSAGNNVNGFLVGGPTRTEERQYIQEVGYLFGEDIGTPAAVSGGVNTATSSNFDQAEVPNIGDVATKVEGSVLNETVSYSLKTITAFVQAFDARGAIAESTLIRVQGTLSRQLRERVRGSVSLVEATCRTSQELGYCVVQLTLPDEWFARTSTDNNDRVFIWANFASSTQNGNLIGNALVENSPAYATNLTLSRPITLVPPSHTVFPSRNFFMEVYVVSPLVLVYSGVEADISWTEGTLTGITFDEKLWQCGMFVLAHFFL